jgi:hypothetical protein
MGGQGTLPNHAGFVAYTSDAGSAPCPAPVSPTVGTAFGYAGAAVGTSDVLAHVLVHPVSDGPPQKCVALVTLSQFSHRNIVDATSGSLGMGGVAAALTSPSA